MRKGRRKAWLVLGIALLATPPPSLRADGGDQEPPVRLTVEIDWSVPALPALPSGPEPAGLTLRMTEGRVIEALAWPSGTSLESGRQTEGTWRLGTTAPGRVRARIEAPVGSNLEIQAAGQVFQFPVVAILEGPQRTAPSALADIGVERLAWDALEITAEGDGTAPPGGSWPLGIGFNLLTPGPAEVAVRVSAELRPIRGGNSLWQADQAEIVATNAPRAPALALEVPAPVAEGTYVLEVRASWEPIAGREGSRIGRWLGKRRRGPNPASATRRVTLAVVDPRAKPPGPAGGPDVMVDAFDLVRQRPYHAMASGRARGVSERAPWPVPEAALSGSNRVDRLRGLIGRGGNEASTLGPADPNGVAWSSMALRVQHPGRPHRLTVKVLSGPPSGLGVALVAPGGNGRPRVFLDACASGPPVEGTTPAAFSWPVWPDAAEPVLVVFNRSTTAPVRVGAVELTELAADPPPATLAEASAEASRTLALALLERSALDRFGGVADAATWARNLASYAAHCGASSVVLPDDLADRTRRRALGGQADEDVTGPDKLDLVLRLLARRGLSAVLEARFDAPLPGLPAPEAPEALRRGLVRVDARGLADGPAYQPLHPEVREAMRLRVTEAIAPRRTHPNLTGLVIRLGRGCTLPGGPETGLDDATYDRFVRAAFRPEDARGVPGLAMTGAGRFATRQKFVAGPGEQPWLTWRAREVGTLYADLAQAVRKAAPGATLAVVTPGLDGGPAGSEARRCDQSGLAPDRAWRAVGLVLKEWPGEGGPVVLRGVGPTSDDLGHDLAVDPALDEQVAARPARGLMLLPPGDEASPEPRKADAAPGPSLSAAPIEPGPAGDELLGHALAALDARWVVLSAAAIAGREESIRRFARVYRALPAPAEARPMVPKQPSGVAVRSWSVGGRTYLALANDTPYALRLDTELPIAAGTAVDDLGRGLHLTPEAAPGGGRRLVLDLAPFGAAALRIGREAVQPGPLALYSFRDGPEAQAAALKDAMDRLWKGAGLPNPGFEPDRPPAAEINVVRNGPIPGGWTASGDMANALEIDGDRPHSGQVSLRLEARGLPASAVGDWFAPPGGSALTLHAWLRSDPPDARVRVWIDGLAAGKPIARHAEITVPGAWTEIGVTAPDLPPEGLERARLRFEMLAAGRLWIDDLALAGQGPSEPERRAQRAIAAALQAYKEGRYADFARLAGSSRVRSLGLPAIAEPTGGPARAGIASDLPGGRRLR